MSELDDQRVELLPARETLYYYGGTTVNVWASNAALAFNVASQYTNTASAAVQSISIG